MRKGTVLSIENDVAIVFTDDCGLIRVPFGPDMAIGREIMLAETAVEPVRRAATRIQFWKPALAAALLLFVVTAGLWFGQGRWPLAAYARISVDVNPGIELVLDRRLAVREVLIFDEGARQLAAGVQLKGLDWREAIEQWAGVLIEERSEKLERMLLGVTLSQHDEAFLTQLREMAGTANAGALAGVEVWVLYATDPDVARLAETNGLSVGRQMVLHLAMDQQMGWGIDQVATAPLSDLVDLISADADPDQDPVMARIRERNVTRSSSGEPSATQTSSSPSQTTGKSSAEKTSSGMTSGQTSGKLTENSTMSSTTGESQTGGSTAKESSSGQTTGSTSGKMTSGSGTGSTTTQSQPRESVTDSTSPVGGTSNRN